MKENNIDLRRVGTILGMPMYIDMAGVKDFTEETSLLSNRQRKLELAKTILKNAIEQRAKKPTEEEVLYALELAAMSTGAWDNRLSGQLHSRKMTRIWVDIDALLEGLTK